MKFLVLLLPVCIFAFYHHRGEEHGRHHGRFALKELEENFGRNPEGIKRHLERLSRRKHHRLSKEERKQCDKRRKRIRKVKLERPDSNPPVDLFEVNNQESVTDYLYQGDINLTEEQLTEIERHLAEDPTSRTKRQASNWITKWTNNTLYYYFDAGLDERKRASVTTAVNYLQKHTCLNFVQSSTATNRMRVFRGIGCWAHMGMGGEKNISIGDGCEVVGTCAHEFTHALGIYHSQMRSDRDNYVTVDLSVVGEDKHHNFDKLSPQESQQNTPYEYGGFMHYGANAFVNKSGIFSIIPNDAKYAYTMGHRQITFYDIEMINKFYGCDTKCAPSTSAICLNGGTPNPKNCAICNCPAGYGGALCDERPLGCGETLNATANWQKKVITVGSTSSQTVYDDFRLCNYWIKAPDGQKIETKITDMYNPQCQYGCPFNGIEIKTDPNTKMTNPKYCCPEFNGDVLTSELNPTPIIAYNRYYESDFTVEYRAVPQGTPSPTPITVPTTTPTTKPPTTTPTTTTTTKPTTTLTTTSTTTTTTKPTTTPTTTTTTKPTTVTTASTSTSTVKPTTKTTTTTPAPTTTTSPTVIKPERNCTQTDPHQMCIDLGVCNSQKEHWGFKNKKISCAQTCGLCGKIEQPCEDHFDHHQCVSMVNYTPMEKEWGCAKMYGYCEYPN